MRYNFIIL